jgi:hypothetical protein
MDTYTIELRQKDASISNKNGDWESIVKEKIILNDGDTVVMKSAFLDTEASSNQKINIPTDITLQFEFGKWWYYFYPSSDTSLAPIQLPDLVTKIAPTNELYYQAKVAGGTNIGGAGAIPVLDFVLPPGFSGSSKPFQLTLSYRDMDGEDKSRTFNIPSYKGTSLQEFQFTVNPPIFYDVSVEVKPNINNLVMAAKYNIALEILQSIRPTDEVTVQPIIYKRTLSLPKGSYSPVDLCNFINTNLTTVERGVGTGRFYGNPFLQPTQFIQDDYFANVTAKRRTGSGIPAGNMDVVNQNIPADPSDLKFEFAFLVGASQVELSFIDAQQRFEWKQLNTPILDSQGTAIVDYDTGADLIRAAYSGIYWTNLSATIDSNGEFFDFWENLLGFDLASIYPKTSLSTFADTFWKGFIENDTLQVNVELKTGVNITQGAENIAALLPTSNAAQQASKGFFNMLQGTVGNPTNGIQQTIKAANSVLSAVDKFGYYLMNSYTSASEADSIVYTHSGNPVFLDSFKCRILDSDKIVANNLGSDNTIFLQIVKAENNIKK